MTEEISFYDYCTKSILYKLLSDTARIPEYKTKDAAGFDLFANLPLDSIVLQPHSFVIIPLGFSTEIAPGWQVSIRPRSGLAFNFGVTVGNSPGTIDADYRGEWKILLLNQGGSPYSISHHDRIAQGILEPVYRAHFIEAKKELSSTQRAEGGFGSTGK